MGIDESGWAAGFLCDDHGESFCADCKPKSLLQVVYITAGGNAYHLSLDCEGLRDGQRAVEQRGGNAADPMSVSVSTAKGDGRAACLRCWPSEAAGDRVNLPRSAESPSEKPRRQEAPRAPSVSPAIGDTGELDVGGARLEQWPWTAAARELRGALESAARHRQTLTYTDAAKAVRCMDLDATSTALVLLLCQQVREDAANDLPLLSSLVIGRRRNQPGKGFFHFARQFFRFEDNERFWLAEVEAVFSHYGRSPRRRPSTPGMTHRVAVPTSPEQRPEDQNEFIMSFFD